VAEPSATEGMGLKMPERRKSTVATPPTLTRRRLAMRMRRLRTQFPAELVQAAAGEIIAALSSALAGGRPIILRGFGRFQVRRYRNSAKRLGVIFKASPELTARLNRKP